MSSAKTELSEALASAQVPIAFTVARACVYVILTGAPLAFGAVQPWAWGLISLLTSLALLSWALGCVQAKRVRLTWSHLYVPFLAVLVLSLVQLASGLSLDPIASRESAIKLITYLLLFFLMQQLFVEATTQQWERFAFAASVFAFAIAMFAMIQFFVSPGTVYGVVKPRWGGYIFGPYISHNNYAGLMEMLIPFPLALVVGLRRGHPARLALGFSALVAFLSVLLSGSRAGALALVVELLVFGAIALRSSSAAGKTKRAVAVGAAVVALLGCFFLWVDPGGVYRRWDSLANSPDLRNDWRMRMTVDSLHMSHDHFLAGVGLGAFERAYPRYQSFATDLLIEYAHNDYVQFVAETGLLGWVVTPLAILLFLKMAFTRIGKRIGTAIGWTQMAAAIAVCGILVHSWVDFNLHIPANAAWFSICVALAVLPRSGCSLLDG